MTFRLGTRTHLADGERAADIAAIQGGLALVEEHERAKFLSELAITGARATPIDRFSGLNYSRGREMNITVYRVTPAVQVTSPPPE